MAEDANKTPDDDVDEALLEEIDDQKKSRQKGKLMINITKLLALRCISSIVKKIKLLDEYDIPFLCLYTKNGHTYEGATTRVADMLDSPNFHSLREEFVEGLQTPLYEENDIKSDANLDNVSYICIDSYLLTGFIGYANGSYQKNNKNMGPIL